MEHEETSEIVLVSGTCCRPSLARMEKKLERQLRATIEEMNLDTGVRIVSLSSVLAGEAPLADGQAELVHALFQKYGARFAPAGLVDQRVLFAGGAPTPDELKETLTGL
jgi:hypothetical protein